MFTHKEFVDARLELFAKYSSKQWSRIVERTGRAPIAKLKSALSP